jgi:hypothetical protein
MKLKPVVIVFILVELLDIITTLINLSLPGIYEFNSFMARMATWNWIAFKLVVTLIICILMQRLKLSKRWILVPILAGIIVLVNIVVFFMAFGRLI